MANTLSFAGQTAIPSIQMSNGLTSAFIGVLAIATAAQAVSDRHKQLAAWIASRDQEVMGSGAVGFDICDMPWESKSFATDVLFLRQCVQAANTKSHWEKSGYAPREDTLLGCLACFDKMLDTITLHHVQDHKPYGFFSGGPAVLPFTLCPQHAVYLHAQGCVICNESVET
jgi:hypothetical protein